MFIIVFLWEWLIVVWEIKKKLGLGFISVIMCIMVMVRNNINIYLICGGNVYGVFILVFFYVVDYFLLLLLICVWISVINGLLKCFSLCILMLLMLSILLVVIGICLVILIKVVLLNIMYGGILFLLVIDLCSLCNLVNSLWL